MWGSRCSTFNFLRIVLSIIAYQGPSCLWSYGSWIYNYLCNQCLSPLMLWVRISIRARCTTLCDNVCQWLETGRWFSPISETNKTDVQDIAELLLKVALNTIKPNQALFIICPSITASDYPLIWYLQTFSYFIYIQY